jgi:hypothetical protein
MACKCWRFSKLASLYAHATFSDQDQWLFIEEVVYYTVHWMIKSAFLFFYLSPNKTFRKFVFIGVILNGSIWIINMYESTRRLLPATLSDQHTVS